MKMVLSSVQGISSMITRKAYKWLLLCTIVLSQQCRLPFSNHEHYAFLPYGHNKFWCSSPNSMRMGDGKQLYYKSWPYTKKIWTWSDCLLVCFQILSRVMVKQLEHQSRRLLMFIQCVRQRMKYLVLNIIFRATQIAEIVSYNTCDNVKFWKNFLQPWED